MKENHQGHDADTGSTSYICHGRHIGDNDGEKTNYSSEQPKQLRSDGGPSPLPGKLDADLPALGCYVLCVLFWISSSHR